MDDKQIYEKLREFRRARGMSVDQLAKEMGENSQKVGRIERGQRSLTVDYLLKISKALSAPLDTFLEDKEIYVEVEPSNHFDSNILNSIVVLVEDVACRLPMECAPQRKAKMISNLYEMILKLPNENRCSFVHLLSDCLNVILQNR